MKIAVVILNWNGRKLLEQFLPSVVNNSDEATIYVIDNHSKDDSVSFLKTHFKTVKLILLNENKGYSGGYNEGLKEVHEELYCLLNNDVEVPPNWLAPIKKEFLKDPKIAIAQPHILNYHSQDTFDYAGAAGGYLDKFGYPYCRGRVLNMVEKDQGQYDELATILWASGACFFIRKKIFTELNGFDSDFFMHQEEIDLCWRAFNKGYKAISIGCVKVFHLGGGSLPMDSPQKVYYNFRNSLLMLCKNVKQKDLFIVIFTRLILDGTIGVHYLFNGKWRAIVAVIKAHWSFFCSFIITLKKREKINFKKYYTKKINSFKIFFLTLSFL